MTHKFMRFRLKGYFLNVCKIYLCIFQDHNVIDILLYGILFYRKVNERLKQQLDRLWHTTNIYMHPGIHEYAEKLTAKLPGDLKVNSSLSLHTHHIIYNSV